MEIPLRILMVEDNEADARLMRLELLEGGIAPQIDCVTCRDEFIGKLETEPDVIIADIQLPSFGAEEVLSLLRERKCGLPVIVVTGRSDDLEARRFLDMGAADYLLKDRLARLAPATVRVVYEQRMREKFEADLAETNLRLQAIWKNSIDALRLTDAEGTILEVNDSYCELVDMPREKLVGQPFTVAFPPEMRQKSLANYRKLFRAGAAITGFRQERRLRFASGKECDVEVSISPVEWRAGDPWLLAIFRDVSERNQLENQFLRAQRLEGIGAFAGSIVHDFNNILAPIMMAGSLLRGDPSRPDAEKALSIIEQSTQRGSELIRRILLFSRGIDGEKKPMRPERLLEDMFRFVSETFPRNIQFTGTIHEPLWEIVGDSTQLYQVLLNLSINARDAMAGGGQLLMEARNMKVEDEVPNAHPVSAPGAFLQIAVDDSGCGIDLEATKKLFDPLYSTKAEGKGSGLGLPTTMRIVLSHGGFLAVHSSPGNGARFEVYLPARGEGPPIEPDSDDLQVMEDHQSQSAGATANGEVVLVVDDEGPIRALAAKILERRGYRPLCACHGEEALEIFDGAAGSIRVVLTDLAMPRMDGVELARRLRKRGCQAPLIAMSGNLTERSAEALHDEGVCSIIEKPFTGAELLGALYAALHQDTTPAAPGR